MVSKRSLTFVTGMLLLPMFLAPFQGAHGQTISYQVDKEYIKMWINQDGTIDLQYNIGITCLSGSIGGFYVGMPNGDFKIGSAVDEGGTALSAADASSGDNYRIDVTLARRIGDGESTSLRS